jgi:hypothetical protein
LDVDRKTRREATMGPAWLMLLMPPLLVVLLLIERRRERAHRELLERAELDLLTPADLQELDAEDDELTWRESLARFLRGAPTRRLTADRVWGLYLLVTSGGLIGFLLYTIAGDAVRYPVVRKVVLATIAVMAAVVGANRLLRRGVLRGQRQPGPGRDPAAPIEPR